jgi:transposase
MDATQLQAISDTLMRIVTPDMTPKQYQGGAERAPERVEDGHHSGGVLFDYRQRPIRALARQRICRRSRKTGPSESPSRVSSLVKSS